MPVPIGFWSLAHGYLFRLTIVLPAGNLQMLIRSQAASPHVTQPDQHGARENLPLQKLTDYHPWVPATRQCRETAFMTTSIRFFQVAFIQGAG
jgi:hypothetical protein